MIGRFSHQGVYRELMLSGEFHRTALAGVLALVSFLWDKNCFAPSHVSTILALSSVGLNGLPIVWGAVQGLMERRVNVDELVSLAIIASLIQGEYLTAAVVGFVMVMGSLIEQATSESARKAIQSLIDIAPETATVMADGREQTVPLEQVKVGDRLLVKPGERIPVDGRVTKGVTAVDESSMTGEPIPVEKSPGDNLSSGTLNQNGVIEMEATRVGEDTTLSKVIKLVADAEAHKPKGVRIVDRYAQWFTPAILLCAGITWFVTQDVSRAITVLIVGCPCALILAAPTAIVATIGRAARAGILVKGGGFLEEVGRADVVLFDKTGTLTEGKPLVGAIVTVDGFSNEDALAKAASVEQHSTHPLARAVLKAAHYARVTIQHAEEMFTEIGLGVRARVEGRLVEVGSAYMGGDSIQVPLSLRSHLETFKESGATPLVIFEEHQPVAVMSVADHVRDAAATTVAHLKSLGMERVGILSGDHEKSVRRVADSVGITDTWSELKPQDKLEVITGFQGKKHSVIFVGDGINDAPALTVANVGIAMGAAGTHVALETADIALMKDDISRLPFLIGLSRRMTTTIKWNIAFGVIFNVVAVAASGAGFLTPIMGAVVHNVGSVLVVLSSASLVFASDNQA
ncbi:MAG: cation-translocating P-type ATPase [Deltaproteobacteria bacterium]|nr:cation-translocating P-type ATPase [Deltaproteobacteria bacterium]TLN01380.1 MAG: cation-translocating P-type ATPase [bacterium]